MDGNLVPDKSDISKGNWEKVDNPMNNTGQLYNYLTKRKSDLLYFTASSRWINELKSKNIFKNRL